ncbi:MAG TPA: DMT family transporter, partial [Vicinamibacteria bacterium]|nr:DMT family transporter [Vicinamibacteria bacterium]
MNETAAATSPTPLRVHAALVAVSLLFGANTFVAKIALREVAPLALVVLRTAGAAAILFAVSRRPRGSPAPPFTRGDYARLLAYSLLGASINQVAFLEGLARSTATNAALMVVVVPVLTLGFAVALGRERASLAGILGIALGLAGALLLILPRGGVEMAARAVLGNLLLLVSGASYALYLVLTRSMLARQGPLRVVSWTFLFAALTLWPLGLPGLRDVLRSGLTATGAASVAYVVIGGTAVPYLLNNWALARVHSSIVAVYV